MPEFHTMFAPQIFSPNSGGWGEGMLPASVSYAYGVKALNNKFITDLII